MAAHILKGGIEEEIELFSEDYIKDVGKKEVERVCKELGLFVQPAPENTGSKRRKSDPDWEKVAKGGLA